MIAIWQVKATQIILKIKTGILTFICACLLLCVCPAVFPQTQIVFAESPWPPYIIADTSTDEIRGGTMVELVKTIFARLEDTQVSFLHMPWERLLYELELGNVDAVSLLEKNPHREVYLDYSDLIMTSDNVFFYATARHPKGITWHQLADLKKYHIGAIFGYVSTTKLGEAINNGVPIKLQRIVATDEQMFRMLLQNRFDLVPFGEQVGKELIKQHGWQGKIAAVSPPLYSANYYMGFSKSGKHQNLIKRINEVLAQMRQAGELEKILHPQD